MTVAGERHRTTTSHRDVEGFLFREARLLDEHRYEDWLALWVSGGRYWVPSNRPDLDPTAETSLIYETTETLADRVFRMRHPATHAQHPLSRMVRLVSNVETSERDDSGIDAHSAYVLTVNRRGQQTIYAARVDHNLVRESDTLRIASKKVVLSSVNDSFANFTFLP